MGMTPEGWDNDDERHITGPLGNGTCDVHRYWAVNNFDEAVKLHALLDRLTPLCQRIELAEEALRQFAHHTQGIMAPNAAYKAWRDFVNESEAKGGV